MTNVDLYDLVDYIAYLRNIPERESNLYYLNCSIDALAVNDKDTLEFYEIMRDSCSIESEERDYIPSPKIVVEDNNIYYVFKNLFVELKRLFLLKQYEAFYCLADDFHNLPTDILKNNLKLSFNNLKKCLKRYWKKYNRHFLREYVDANIKHYFG